MSKIPVLVSEEVVSLLGVSGEELERSVLEALVLGMYRPHDISARRAARLPGMEIMAFLRWTGEMGIPYIDMTEEEWGKELQTIKELDAIRQRER